MVKKIKRCYKIRSSKTILNLETKEKKNLERKIEAKKSCK